jgi:hypothetical protein
MKVPNNPNTKPDTITPAIRVMAISMMVARIGETAFLSLQFSTFIWKKLVRFQL